MSWAAKLLTLLLMFVAGSATGIKWQIGQQARADLAAADLRASDARQQRLLGDNLQLDLPTWVAGRQVNSVERINLGNKGNALTVSLAAVLAADEGGFDVDGDGFKDALHQLMVDKGAQDSVTILSPELWTQAADKFSFEGSLYNVYTHNTEAAQLLVLV